MQATASILFARPWPKLSEFNSDLHLNVSRDGRWAVVSSQGTVVKGNDSRVLDPTSLPDHLWKSNKGSYGDGDVMLVNLKTGARPFLYHAPGPGFKGVAEVLEFLAGLPDPTQVLALRPSPQHLERVAELLARSKAGGLSVEEEREWAQHEFLEHLVRRAKARALALTAPAPA